MVNNKEFASNLEKRTRMFAVNIIRISTLLPDISEARVIRYQLTKAGTSIGANYREANRARSKSDFRSRIRICESEASETQYWLEVILDLNWLPPEKIQPIYKEACELLSLFASISTSCSRT
jgi:four helix bundle protein